MDCCVALCTAHRYNGSNRYLSANTAAAPYLTSVGMTRSAPSSKKKSSLKYTTPMSAASSMKRTVKNTQLSRRSSFLIHAGHTLSVPGNAIMLNQMRRNLVTMSVKRLVNETPGENQ